MFIETRDESRDFFLSVWSKMATNAPLEPLEALIAEVINEHPEYHATLDDPERAMGAEFDGPDPMPNPFFHMGLHIALIEQLQTDRPKGIRACYQQLINKASADKHDVEHRIGECLGEALWQAARDGVAPDEAAYLAAIKRLLA